MHSVTARDGDVPIPPRSVRSAAQAGSLCGGYLPFEISIVIVARPPAVRVPRPAQAGPDFRRRAAKGKAPT